MISIVVRAFGTVPRGLKRRQVELESRGFNRDYPDNGILYNGQNTGTSPGNLKKLAVTWTPEKDYQKNSHNNYDDDDEDWKIEEEWKPYRLQQRHVKFNFSCALHSTKNSFIITHDWESLQAEAKIELMGIFGLIILRCTLTTDQILFQNWKVVWDRIKRKYWMKLSHI